MLSSYFMPADYNPYKWKLFSLFCTFHSSVSFNHMRCSFFRSVVKPYRLMVWFYSAAHDKSPFPNPPLSAPCHSLTACGLRRKYPRSGSISFLCILRLWTLHLCHFEDGSHWWANIANPSCKVGRASEHVQNEADGKLHRTLAEACSPPGSRQSFAATLSAAGSVWLPLNTIWCLLNATSESEQC